MNLRLLNTLITAGLSTIWAHNAMAQSANELDLTIRVLDENESPGELINRIKLPPPDYFNREFSVPSLQSPDVSETAADDALVMTEESEQTGVDSIRERISIDGIGTASAGNPDDQQASPVSAILPESVVNILDQDIPLQQSLKEDLQPVVEAVGGIVVDTAGATVDSLTGNTFDTAIDTDTGAIVDVTTDTATDVTDDVSDLLGDSMELDNPPQVDSSLEADALIKTDLDSGMVDDAADVNFPELTDQAQESVGDSADLTDSVEQLTDSILNQ